MTLRQFVFTLRNDVPLSRKIRMRFEEISSFKNCSKIIVHNEKMKSFMHEKWKYIKINGYIRNI